MTGVAAESRELVGPYRVIRAIGAGGSARIDLARIDRAYGFQRHVVVKRPLEHLRGNPKVAASLHREARIGGRLHHPNLVAVLDAGSHDGYDYLVLEYVHGASLRTVMQTEAAGQVHLLPLGVALAIITDVARGMHEAHELTDEHGGSLGLVHRDVSPGNILLGLDGTVKLADFGIAKETHVSTLSGSLHGTVTYMAPEQCQGHAFDRRADVFSLGVILYELVTGTRLFWADNDVASLHRVLSGHVPPPREVRPALPAALEAIVLTAVAHAPGDRYPTARALADAIEGYAATAGEVLGARWIAREMAELIGPRPVPWIAAATVPDAAPRSDGSLVDLIVAAEPDEPASPTFGDAPGDGDEAAEIADHDLDALRDTVSLAAITEPPRELPGLAAPSAPSATTRAAASPGGNARTAVVARPDRRKRAVLAGIIALGVIGGAAATAIVMTRGPDGAATGAPGSRTETMRDSAARDSAARDSAARDSAARDSAGSAVAGHPAPDTSPRAPAVAGGPITDGGDAKPARPDAASDPARGSAAAPARLPAKKHHATPRPHPAHDAAAATATARPGPATEPPAIAPAGTGSAAPPARPPENVEWKPTLLLPTDGSGARTPR